MRDAWRGARAAARWLNDDPKGTRLAQFRPTRDARVGVVTHEASACPGWTLFTTAAAPKATLIDLQGQVIQTWQLSLQDAARGLNLGIIRSEHVYWRKAELTAEGGVVAIYTEAGTTPWGRGLVRVDAKSQLQWYYPGRAHHDFDLLEDERIMTLVHELRATTAPAYKHLKAPLLENFVVELNAAGKPIRKVSLTQAVAESPYKSLLVLSGTHRRSRAKFDYLHPNAVHVVRASEAVHLPEAVTGDVLVHTRPESALILLSWPQGKVKWVKMTPMTGGHDPTLLPNGDFLGFDNRGHIGPEGASRVVQFSLDRRRQPWSYVGSAAEPLQSMIRSAIQPLCNNHVLITESDAGKILEVNRQGQVVWSYQPPERDEKTTAAVCQALRYSTLPWRK